MSNQTDMWVLNTYKEKGKIDIAISNYFSILQFRVGVYYMFSYTFLTTLSFRH